MSQHPQQRLFLGGRLGDALVEAPVARLAGEERVDGRVQARPVRCRRLRAIRVQVVMIAGSAVRQERLHQRTVLRENGGTSLDMSPGVDSAQRHLRRHALALRRVVKTTDGCNGENDRFSTDGKAAVIVRDHERGPLMVGARPRPAQSLPWPRPTTRRTGTSSLPRGDATRASHAMADGTAGSRRTT